jgi:hypothetical protein
MHIDGCHFFAWVYETPQGGHELTLYDRSGDDLAMHANDGECERCTALLNGARPREQAVTLELSDDVQARFYEVLAEIGRLDELAS